MSASNTPSTLHLAWLLACLRRAVEALDEIGCDVDARVVEAHRAELAAGREWPGERVTCPPEFIEPPRVVDDSYLDGLNYWHMGGAAYGGSSRASV